MNLSEVPFDILVANYWKMVKDEKRKKEWNLAGCYWYQKLWYTLFPKQLRPDRDWHWYNFILISRKSFGVDWPYEKSEACEILEALVEMGEGRGEE